MRLVAHLSNSNSKSIASLCVGPWASAIFSSVICLASLGLTSCSEKAKEVLNGIANVENRGKDGSLTITSPSTSIIYQNSNSFVLSGTCKTSARLELQGDTSDAEMTTPLTSKSLTCDAGTFSYHFNKASDGSYIVWVRQSVLESSAFGSQEITSESERITFVRDTISPPAPSVDNLPSNPYASNSSALVLTGTCEGTSLVNLAGADIQSTSCSGGRYTFNITKTSDDTYDFLLSQSDQAGNSSPAASQRWIRDSVLPNAPTITTPASNPLLSGDDTIQIAGGCEDLAQVILAGDSSQTTFCAAGAYAFSFTETRGDSTYDFFLSQTDTAGNTSGATSFRWTRSTSVPATPTLIAPSQSPYFSNTNVIGLDIGCDNGNSVRVRDLSDSSVQTQTCANAHSAFALTKNSDGDHLFSIDQQDPLNGNASASLSFQWTRDTAPPAPLVLTQPGVNPYTSAGDLTLGGSCDIASTVQYSQALDTQSQQCPGSGLFSFSISRADGTYVFSLTQTDRAGNVSIPVTQTWTRDSSIPATPTITSPSISPFWSNTSPLVLSGGCTNGLTVYLSGDSSQNQACVGGSYSFSISKSPGNYTFTVKQQNGAGTFSGGVSQQWNLDQTGPIVTISSAPSSPNLNPDSTFAFSANEGTLSIECRLDGGSWASCTSPLTFSSLSRGDHVFEVRATDLAGNLGSAATHSWHQQSYRTVALYHLDNAPSPLVDSSRFTGSANNPLTLSGDVKAIASLNAGLSQARRFGNAGGLLSAADSVSFDSITDKLTVEAWVRFTNLPGGNSYQVLVSQNQTPNNQSWELRVKRSGGNYYLSLVASNNGTNTTETLSNPLLLSTNTWYHVAAEFRGDVLPATTAKVAIFLNGAVVSPITNLGFRTLFNSTAPLRIGANPSGSNRLRGDIDEIRISNNNRYPADFSAALPTSPFSAD